MNVLLWFFQILLALHTAVGAVWKSSNTEHTMPTLEAIPHAIWVGLIGVELLCAVALVAGAFDKRLGVLAPIAAVLIAVEMLFFTAVHLASGSSNAGPIVYWSIVAAICAFVAYGRLVLRPIRRGEFA